jgi:hypothetical protein
MMKILVENILVLACSPWQTVDEIKMVANVLLL